VSHLCSTRHFDVAGLTQDSSCIHAQAFRSQSTFRSNVFKRANSMTRDMKVKGDKEDGASGKRSKSKVSVILCPDMATCH